MTFASEPWKAENFKLHRENHRLWHENERLREYVRRAAEVFDCHIDEPQVCSHAELRATAREFRNALHPEDS